MSRLGNFVRLVTHDDWPYDEPRKWFVPAFVNRWLGNRSWNQAVILRPVCWVLGHDSIDDQCMKPEHMFCVRCMKPTPKPR